ncbi:MAG: pyruvate, phosphate dikinase [Gemmatimonadota bacterium]|jgi:pyruvate,orthophosphate dikinase
MKKGKQIRTVPAVKRIHYFGKLGSRRTRFSAERLGGKGASLAYMRSLGLPVPPGFTITTEVCAEYYDRDQKFPPGLMDQVKENLSKLEKEMSKGFGAEEDPLLVSVRSGAAASMPGMMDTILNLGLNDKNAEWMAEATENERATFDAYRRLIHMFGDVVMAVDHEYFEEAFAEIKKQYGAVDDTEVPAKGLRELVGAYKRIYKEHTKEAFPQDPYRQLTLAIHAVFRSWNSPRAKRYREINHLHGYLGTAVTVQAMVFGNLDDYSGTGVCFTRNPATGEDKLFGEFLVNAQGEDVVAGIRTPRDVQEMAEWNPKVLEELREMKWVLEGHFKDMQDLEFTVERGDLYMLQSRRGQRTGAAAVRIAVDMVEQGIISKEEALLRIPPQAMTQFLLPSFSAEDKEGTDVLTTGLPASPGAARGKLAFTAEDAVRRASAGEDVILVRRETSPEDVDGMHHAKGILTSTGGMTSHAAVVARGWGKCCVVGAGDLAISASNQTVTVGGKTFGPESVISIDGSTGEVMEGEVEHSQPELSGYFGTVMEWGDEYRTLGIRANADTPEEALRARQFGATGIGLCRTEHMFFGAGRIEAMQEMILSDTTKARRRALAKLLPIQREDFKGILSAMKGFPVTIRLLDPPLHEFLPREKARQKLLAESLGISLEEVLERVEALEEANPMLGHRGCRLAVTYPEIPVMQVTAIVEAAIECRREGVRAQPEIMVPLVGTDKELTLLRGLVEKTISEVMDRQGYSGNLKILVGTMIEVPRAALTAGAIAEAADFFSFGTNDLTQMTYGFSRDDVNSFLPDYLSQDILGNDPFFSLDQTGVGRLVRMATEEGRERNPDLKVGICGEHGGEAESIEFFHDVGLDYVSCSSFRVPVARLAAAQAALHSDGWEGMD